MPKFRFAKLVRDKIVEHQVASGAKPHYRMLNDEEHKKALIKKIIEEAEEIAASKPEDVANEIADVQQALDDLKEKYGLSDKDISVVQAKKRRRNGAFKEGYYIDYVEAVEKDEWTSYYRKNSDRYPEID